MSTSGEEPEPPAEPSVRGMSWWTRSWVTLGVLIAIGVTASGIVLVRHLLDRSVDPRAVLKAATDRLGVLDPELTGFTLEGSDVSVTVRCAGQDLCASASRHFRPDGHTTAATLRESTDAWASGFGLGSASSSDSQPIQCGFLTAAPAKGLLCDVATYAVPGDTGQHVHVFAQLSADGKTASSGAFTRSQVAAFAVGSVYVQVLGSIS